FTAVMQGHKSYVSSLEPAVAGPAPGAITIAAPLNPAHPTGIITALYTIDTVKGWMNGIPSSMLKWTSVVDQNGIILAGADLGIAGPLPNANNHPEVKQVLAGQSGSEFILQNGRQTLVVRHPLSSLGWGVLVEIPAQEIDKAFWNFERPIALIGLFF